MTPATLQRSLEINPHRVGRPRLDPYKRLLSRFYEQLFLLNALGQTRGSHTILSSDVHHSRAQSRRFLQNLCFVCDFKKGGSTCTAIGLEELDTHYNFCVASNGETDTIVAFLRTTLGDLRARACPVGTGILTASCDSQRCALSLLLSVSTKKRDAFVDTPNIVFPG